MPHQEPGDGYPERRYDETTHPDNPPNSVVRPAARRRAFWTFFGGIVVLFAIVGAAFLFWSATDRRIAPGGEPDPSAVGTSGERMPREGTPGGFDPAPRQNSAADEIEFRGGGEPPQGPMPGLGTIAPLTQLSTVREGSRSLAGRRVDFENVEVARADGPTFWIRDGDAQAAVTAAGNMPTVRAGQRVDVAGTIEDAADGNVRIRATRIDVR